MDEATPHIHVRKVWEYTDENGNIAVGQAKALEEMEVERPDPSKPVSRNNNAKMTYTAECREKMMELCKAKGYELITEPEKRPKASKICKIRVCHRKADAGKPSIITGKPKIQK